MNFEQIQNANATIKTTDVKGKAYAEVNQRIKAFRMVHPDGSIETDILTLVDGVVTMKATVKDANGKLLGTGLAQEKEKSSFINKTSFIENCETSAVGRALGMCGFGIDTSIASAEELQNALLNQNKKDDEDEDDNDYFNDPATAFQRKRMCDLAQELYGDEWKEKLTLVMQSVSAGAQGTQDLTISEADNVIRKLEQQ
jgi:hypothetical protein